MLEEEALIHSIFSAARKEHDSNIPMDEWVIEEMIDTNMKPKISRWS